MSGADTLEQRVKRYMHALPGKRGLDIPEQTYDRILDVAMGITQPMFGKPPTPHQLQHLYDVGAHTPEAIHAEYGNMAHPHAPNLKVSEYQQYAHALGVFKSHR